LSINIHFDIGIVDHFNAANSPHLLQVTHIIT
jgi:hypothetical protein